MKRTLRFTGILLVVFSATLPLLAQRREDLDPKVRLDPNVALQIRELNEEKESRTKVQQKIDSQLIYALKAHRGQRLTPHVESLDLVGAETDMDGNTVVDISAMISDSLLEQLRANGAYIINAFPEYHSARAIISLDQVEAIAALPGVIFIQPKQEAVTNAIRAPENAGMSDMPAGFSTRAANVRQQLSEALHALAVRNQSVGAAASEGDVAHGANVARATYGITGAGVKIGVLSDGVTSLAASQGFGDLGPVTVLPGQAGASGDEGTAMLEIVHDLAPGAQLYFATAFGGITNFANNIKALRAAGCDIIVDDVFYFAESAFQDGQAPSVVSPGNGGVVIQAVNDVTALGAMYFSSAGNSGNKDDGTSGVWEGDFVDGGASPLIAGGTVHNFGGGVLSNLITNTTTMTLKWNDPLGGSSNDYDLYILNNAGTAVVAALTNVQNGTQDPFEGGSFSQAQSNLRLVVFKKTGSQPRYFQLNTNRGRLAINTAGQTHGHAAAANAFGCAATPAAQFAAPPNPAGPYPNQFNPANRVELFSSDGPRHLFYDPTGNPFTADLTATGGIVRQKPDITAADGVSDTGVGGFGSPFFGTSAAAPHAGAIAALLKSAGSFTNAQVRTALTTTAVDIEAIGVDRDSGAGIVMPTPAAAFLGVTGVATPEIVSFTAAEAPGNGNGSIDPGEGATLTVKLQNNGKVTAGNVVATLGSATPGITIASPNSAPFGNLAPGASASGTYRFMVGPNVSCPLLVDFDLSVSYTGGPSPKSYAMRIHTGFPANVFSGTLNTSPPPASPLYVGGTGTQVGRINRFAPPSVCGTQKQFPNLQSTTGTRRFQTFTFTTCNNPVPSCVTVNLKNPGTLFAVAYKDSYDPTNLSKNYLGDSGTSGNGLQANFNITLPAGTSTLVVVVHEVNAGAGIGANYTLSVDGCITSSCPVRNRPPVALAKNVTTSAGSTCSANASIDNGSSDPDGDALTFTQSPAGPYALGTTSVLMTVTDPKGAFAQATGNVTVVDTTAPSISCPADITVNNAPGSCSANVTVGTPTATDNCSTPTVSGKRSDNQPLTAPYPVGTTAIVWTATDAAGNPSSCSQNVTVKDAEAPSLTVPAPITTEFTDEHGAVVAFTVTSSDNCPGVTQSCSPISGSTFPIGTTPVTCTAVDLASNSTSKTFNVTVGGALTTKLNVLAALQTLQAATTDKQDSDTLFRCVSGLKKATEVTEWKDETHVNDSSVFQNEKDVVNQLTNLIKKRGGDATLQGFVTRIVSSDRLLCTTAINDAATAGASNSTGYAQAVSLRAAGDQMIAAGQYESGIEQYRNSWSKAVGSH